MFFKRFLIVFALSLYLFAMEDSTAVSEDDISGDNSTITLELSHRKMVTINADFVKRFPNLQELNLVRTKLYNNDVSELAEIKPLKKLDLRGVEVQTFEPLAALSELSHLKITSYQIEEDIKHLVKIPHLKYLYLTGSYNNIEVLSQLQNLKKLILVGMFNGLTSKGIPPIDFLSSMKSLEKLDISSNEYIFYIRPVTVLPHLKSLDIAGCVNIRDLVTIGDLKSLKKLDIRGITGPGELPKEEQEAIASLPLLKTLIASRTFDIQTNIKHFKIK